MKNILRSARSRAGQLSLLQKSSKDISSKYDAGIDAVRFVAFLLVFIHHFVYLGGNSLSNSSNVYWVNPVIRNISFFGSEGVTIFFCLSGYLLSKLLIKELSDTGKLSVRSFYIRRLLRIWPVYFLFLLACIFATPLLGNQAIRKAEIPYLVSFTYNWHQIISGQSRGMPAILWSISVEEQIYLVLPLLLIFFSNRGFSKLACLLIALGILSRFAIYLSEHQTYRNTFSYLSTVGIGMLFAVHEKRIRDQLRNHAKFAYPVLCFFILTYILLFRRLFSKGLLNVVAFDITALVAICLLVMLGGSAGNSKRVLLRPFAFLGRRSYGMYIFHWPVLSLMVSRGVFFDSTTGISIPGVLIAFTVVVITATLSYRYFEMPFLTLRTKFQYVKIN